MLPDNEAKRPRFLLLIGYPGVGKSTYARSLRTQGFVVISGDEVIEETRKKYGMKSFDEAREQYESEINSIVEKRIEDSLESGADVAVDAFNTNRDRRRVKKLDRAKESRHNYICEALIFHPPEEEEHARRLIKRAISEGRVTVMDSLLLADLENGYEPPTADEGFEVITYIGTRASKPMMRM